MDTHRRVFLENFLPIVEEVLIECLVLRMIGLEECGIEASDLLGFQRQVDRFTYGSSPVNPDFP